jgi:hypothetical protein
MRNYGFVMFFSFFFVDGSKEQCVGWIVFCTRTTRLILWFEIYLPPFFKLFIVLN